MVVQVEAVVKTAEQDYKTTTAAKGRPPSYLFDRYCETREKNE
jgi:hypothetical protein